MQNPTIKLIQCCYIMQLHKSPNMSNCCLKICPNSWMLPFYWISFYSCIWGIKRASVNSIRSFYSYDRFIAGTWRRARTGGPATVRKHAFPHVWAIVWHLWAQLSHIQQDNVLLLDWSIYEHNFAPPPSLSAIAVQNEEHRPRSKASFKVMKH
jgi:hypothetical protein